MALLSLTTVLQDAAVRNVISMILVSLIAVAITRCIAVFVNASDYRQFCKLITSDKQTETDRMIDKQHTDFYKSALKLKSRTLYMRLPVPWSSETTYYLLDHAPMRKLFARSPKLDAFGLAYRLHDKVWGVPP